MYISIRYDTDSLRLTFQKIYLKQKLVKINIVSYLEGRFIHGLIPTFTERDKFPPSRLLTTSKDKLLRLARR